MRWEITAKSIRRKEILELPEVTLREAIINSVCRNPNIASLLLRCDYIEKMGSGIERIHSALAEANCPDVKIHYNTMFTMGFPRPTYVKVKENSSTDMSSHGTPHDAPHDTPHVQQLLQALIGEMNRGE